MLPSVIMIALFVVTVLLISYTSIKSEYALIVFLMICGIATGANEGMILKKAVFAAIALALFFIIKINVNMFIKASNYIYLGTVILLILALLSEPIAEGSHRYLIIGPVIIEPAPLVAFSILPACNLINKMKRITYADMALIFLFGGLELCLILLLPYVELAFVMCVVAFVMLVKIKADNRINMSWTVVVTIILSVVHFFVILFISRPGSLLLILSRGMSDVTGAGFRLHSTDMAIKAVKLIGSADISHLPEPEMILKMPVICFAVRFGWLCVALLVIAFAILVARLFFMSSAIKNSFARYTCFGIATYFAVGGIYHILVEFVTGYSRPLFLFMGTSSNFIIHSALLAIAFALYSQRDKIVVGRQLDIDYDLTDEVLKDYEHSYKRRLKNTEAQIEKELWKERISELEKERHAWNSKAKSLYEINKKYERYEKELGINENEKDLVFISYNHFDEKYAAYLSEQIEKYGIKAWHFKRDMKPENGSNAYAVAIQRAIRKCRVFVVILSKHSMMSEHVKNEVCLAFNQIPKGTVLMSVRIDDVSIDDDETYGYYLCRQDITNALTPPRKRRLEKFAEKIASIY